MYFPVKARCYPILFKKAYTVVRLPPRTWLIILENSASVRCWDMDTQQSLQPGQPRGWNSALLSSCWSHPCHQGCFFHESLRKDRGGWAGCWQTFIVEAILVTWLLKSLFLFCLFVFTNSHGTQISSYPASNDIYLHTTFKTLFSWILQLCPWSFHQTIGHISWIGIELVIWHLSL